MTGETWRTRNRWAPKSERGNGRSGGREGESKRARGTHRCGVDPVDARRAAEEREVEKRVRERERERDGGGAGVEVRIRSEKVD